VRERLATAQPDDLFLSVVTIGEITHGIARLPAGAKRRELEAWLAMTERHFSDRILPIDRDIAQLWGEMTAKASQAGRVLHVADGLIAATALHHGLRILTRNVKDYEATGVLVLNPWEG
jgi:predicted nucleic acid-binding protein